MIPKTYSELQDKIRAKANENKDSNSRVWPQDIEPADPIMAGSTILTNWDDDKFYKAEFTVDEKSGEITLGESTEVQAVTNYEAVKYARAQGSYEEKQYLIISAIQDGLSRNQYCGIYATYDDHVVVYIGTEDPVTYDYSEETFKIPYSIDDQGKVTLGTSEPVQEVKTFEAMKMGTFVSKDDAKRIVYGPVMIPGCPDCDFERGEKVFTPSEVEDFCHKFNTFRINDDMHTYGANGIQTGDVVENYTLKQEETLTNILGEEITYPVSTWMIGSKVTDDETWNKIQDGTYKGYSGTYISEKDAEKLLESIAATKSETDVLAQLYANKRTLIKDIENPVPVTVSFVDRPCVQNAIFTSIKRNSVFKAGRSISNATLDTLNKAHEKAQTALDGLKELITTAQNERDKTTTEKSIKEVDDMNEDELKTFVEKSVKDATQPLKDELEAQKTENTTFKEEIEALKKEPEESSIKCACGKELHEDDKFCGACGKAHPGEEEKETEVSVKTEDDPVIKGILNTQNLIVEKLGIDPNSQSLNSPESTPESTATKRKSIKEMAERK